MTDKEKLEKIKALADKMYSRMAYLTSDTRPIRQAMDEYHQFIINEYHKEELVSEKLEEAAINYMKSQNPPIWGLYDGFIAGAKYKEEQFEKCAIKTEVCERITQNGLLPSVTVLVNDCKPNEKVKVIVIKEN